MSSLETLNYHIVDVRSDTVTEPTVRMRIAMSEANVGDDVYGEDPTINELETRCAKLFGKEAGLFVPSGTMANLLAIMVHCPKRGSEALVGDLSHTFLYEQGGAAHIAGVQLATLKNKDNGTFCLDELRRKVRSVDYHEPITSLVVVENTHNICGGKVVPLEWLDALSALVKELNAGENGNRIALHMDGARVFNAAAALDVPVARIARDFDSICFCLSKGLSAPVGSVLMGTRTFINEARRLRKALGGGMRQGGILAIAGLVALDTIAPILSKDHEKTKRIAKAIYNLHSPNVTVDLPSVQTNILLINVPNPKLSSSDLANRLKKVTKEEMDAGVLSVDKLGVVVKVSARDWEFARIVLHHQIDDKNVNLLIKKFEYVIKEFDHMLGTTNGHQ